MRARVLLCIPIVLLLLAAEARAQCRVEGVVRLADGTPVAGALVRIEAPDYKQPLTTTSDADGRYVFAEVKPGIRVRIVAVQAGRTVAEEFGLITLRVETLDLKARPVPDSPSRSEDVIATEGPTGEIAGIVSSAEGRPVLAAHLAIENTTMADASDAAGRYEFRGLRPGIHVQLQASAEGYQLATTEVEVPSGSRARVDFALAAATALERSGSEPSALSMPAQASPIAVSPEQVGGVPSVGRNDVFRALQFLPGVQGSLESSTDLFVRGGTPDQNLVTADGFTLYQFADTFGAFSAFNMDAVQSAEFSKSAFDAGDGGRLSGALRLTGPSNPTDKATGFVDLSALGGSALIDLPFGGRGSLMLAARQTPPASLYNKTLDAFSTGVGVAAHGRIPRFSGGTFTNAPVDPTFRDVNGRFEVKLTAKDRLSMSLYDGRDDADNSRNVGVPASPSASAIVPVQGPQLPADALVQNSDIQRWTSRGLSGTWTREWSSGASTTVVVARSQYSRSLDQAWRLTSPSTGEDDSFVGGRGGSAAVSDSNHLRETTMRVTSAFGIGFEHALSIGGDVSSFDVDYAAQTEVAQAHAAGAPGSHLTDLLDQSASGRLATLYAQDAWRPLGRLTLSPGVRVAHYDLAGSTYFDPRVSASYQLTPLVQLKGGWNIDHQVINRITREDLVHGDGTFWSLSDGTAITVPRVDQVFAGGSVNVGGVVLDVEGFYKALDGLTMFAPRLAPGVAPDAGNAYLFHGSGTAKGVEGIIQKEARANTLWVSYTLSKVEDSYPALEAEPFLASYDQTHEFKVVDTLRLGRWPSISGAWVIASGRPYTPAKAAETVWFPSGATVSEITFDSKNSARLPAYHRLDLSTERAVRVRAVKASLGATVFNVYKRKNISSYEYEYAGGSFATNEVTMMGRAVNAFLRVGF
jgi:ferric enterobactin receptor